MRYILIVYIVTLVLSLTRAEQKAAIEKPEITKLEVVNLGEADIDPDSKLFDVQRKRDSGYAYNRPNRVTSRFRIQAHQSKGQVAPKLSGQLSRPFTKYGPPSYSTSGPTAHGYHAQQHRNKLQHNIHQQQPVSFNDELVKQEVPSPIRNVDFAEANPIASQNNEPFGTHTANYLPPQNQKLPGYSSADSFAPQSHSPQNSLGHEQFEDTSSQNQNFAQSQNQHISDAALFLSENAHAIQQLYGAPASNQDFAPGSDQFQGTGNHIQNSNNQFGNFESTSQNSEGFRGALPSYASGTLNPQETLEQIQSLEKDRLIVQLQQALAEAQTPPSTGTIGRYAQNEAGFIQNQNLLASISQQIKTHVPTTPQTFGSGSTVFTQSPFLPGTTVNPLGIPLSYGIPTTAQTPITTTTTVAEVPATQPPQSSKDDGITQAASSAQPASNQPASPTVVPSVGVPIYGGFVPSFITGANLVPSYSTSIFASGPIKPVQSSDSSPTHFGIPIPTEPPQKPVLGSTPSTPAATTPSTTFQNRPQLPGLALTPAITPIIQPIRPVAAPLHPFVTPVHSVALHPVLPGNPTQVHPVQAAPAVTSSVQHTYGVQTALINPVLYKPVKAVYPVYYYTNVAHQLQKPALPSHPWSYAPSYAQTKPAQIWK